MTIEIGFLFLILGAMIILFLTEIFPVDLTAFLGLIILIFAGFVQPNEAFVGFASPAVITMLSIFIVSASLLHTGIADMMGLKIHAWVGSQELKLVVTIMLVSGILSAFMNNIAAVAVLMPSVASLARRANLSPSRLFLPLSFGAIVGGTTTLVGTPPNILVGTLLEERGVASFRLFDFAPLGLILLSVSILFMVTIGRKLLPNRESGQSLSSDIDLANLYQLDEMLFSLRIPKSSSLAGMTLEEVQLGSALGIQVVAVLRGQSKELAPKPATVLNEGDVLLVEGQLSDLKQILQVKGAEIRKTSLSRLPRPAPGFSAIRVRIEENSAFQSKNLKELYFRESYGVIVIAIQRGTRLLRNNLGKEKLCTGDEFVAIGSREALDSVVSESGVRLLATGLSTVRKLQQHLFMIRVNKDSPLAGITLAESRIGELIGLTVGGIVRKGETRLAVSPEEIIRSGDKLLMAGESEKIANLLALSTIQFEPEKPPTELESEETNLVEASLSPRCSLIGKTLKDISFRQRYGLQVLAVWREGAPIRLKLNSLQLTFGDALLLQGSRKKMRILAKDPDFLVLSHSIELARKTKKAPFAIGALLLMVGLVITGLQPIHVAAFTAASLVILAGTLSMEEAYRSVEWRVIFLVAAILPVGVAMERTGTTSWLTDTIIAAASSLEPHMLLAILVVMSSLLSQCLDGAPTVVLMTPVVLQAASRLELSPYPLMMGVALAASAAFMTPFSHKANLLVMGAGGYRPVDYLKVGTPLTIVFLILLTLLVPLFFPF